MKSCDLLFKFIGRRNLEKSAVLFFAFLLLSSSLFSVDVVSIYNIQFTTDPGFDGTYPSPYVNQTVIVQGVVTATGFQGNRAFISEPRGGAWSGIAVDGIANRVSVGDFIQVQGRVSEIMGMTVITNTRGLSVLHRNTPLPDPVQISVHEALTSEAYESVLVQLNNVTCRSVTSGNFIAAIEDGSSRINVGNGFSSNISDHFRIGENYSSVIGIINFSFNQFSIHPRDAGDIRNGTTGIRTQSWGRIKQLYR